MSEGRRITCFEDRDDGMVERWVGREGGELTLDSVFDPEDHRPREEDAYPAEEPHVVGCRVIPVGTEGMGFYDCVEDCPVRAESIRRGQELAEEHGW